MSIFSASAETPATYADSFASLLGGELMDAVPLNLQEVFLNGERNRIAPAANGFEGFHRSEISQIPARQ